MTGRYMREVSELVSGMGAGMAAAFAVPSCTRAGSVT